MTFSLLGKKGEHFSLGHCFWISLSHFEKNDFLLMVILLLDFKDGLLDDVDEMIIAIGLIFENSFVPPFPDLPND